MASKSKTGRHGFADKGISGSKGGSKGVHSPAVLMTKSSLKRGSKKR